MKKNDLFEAINNNIKFHSNIKYLAKQTLPMQISYIHYHKNNFFLNIKVSYITCDDARDLKSMQTISQEKNMT